MADPIATTKPPLGLVPHDVWVYQRTLDIMRAILRYYDDGHAPRQEWFDELRKHIVEGKL